MRWMSSSMKQLVSLFVMTILLMLNVSNGLAADAQLINSETVTAIYQTTAKHTYKITVKGKTLTKDIQSIEVKISGKSYKASFKSSSQTFELNKTLKLTKGAPDQILITAKDKKANSQTLEASLTPELIQAKSIKIMKTPFMDKYTIYKVEGKVTSKDVTKVEVIFGGEKVNTALKELSFSASALLDNLDEVLIRATDKEGHVQVVHYTISVQ